MPSVTISLPPAEAPAAAPPTEEPPPAPQPSRPRGLRRGSTANLSLGNLLSPRKESSARRKESSFGLAKRGSTLASAPGADEPRTPRGGFFGRRTEEEPEPKVDVKRLIEQLTPLQGLDQRVMEQVGQIETRLLARLAGLEYQISSLATSAKKGGLHRISHDRSHRDMGHAHNTAGVGLKGLSLADAARRAVQASHTAPPIEQRHSMPADGGSGVSPPMPTRGLTDPTQAVSLTLQSSASSAGLAEASTSSRHGIAPSVSGDDSSLHGGSAHHEGEEEQGFLRLKTLCDTDQKIMGQLKELREALQAAANRRKHSATGRSGATRAPRRLEEMKRAKAFNAQVEIGPEGSQGKITWAVTRGMTRAITRSMSLSRLNGSSGGGAAGRSRCVRCVQALVGPTLHPDGRFRSVWNATMAVLICYCGIMVPLEIAFEDDMVMAMCHMYRIEDVQHMNRNSCPSYMAWMVTNLIVDAIFMFDIAVNLRTGYIKEGRFEADDAKAAYKYLRSSFVVDVIGSFPINYIILIVQAANNAQDSDDKYGIDRSNKLLRMLRLFKLFKFTRMHKLSAYLEYFEVIIRFNPGLLRIFRLLIVIILSCHLFGCVWWWVGTEEMAARIREGYNFPPHGIEENLLP